MHVSYSLHSLDCNLGRRRVIFLALVRGQELIVFILITMSSRRGLAANPQSASYVGHVYLRFFSAL
jgi:hypothetical protein